MILHGPRPNGATKGNVPRVLHELMELLMKQVPTVLYKPMELWRENVTRVLHELMELPMKDVSTLLHECNARAERNPTWVILLTRWLI